MKTFFFNRYQSSKKQLANVLMAAAAAAGLAGSAQASTIPIINSDFEAGGLSNYTPWPGGPTYGWTPTGTRAEYTAASQYQHVGSTGVAILYDTSSNVGVSQTLSSTWQAATYQLDASIASYRDGSVNTITSALLSGTTVLGSQNTGTVSTIGPTSNNYNPTTPVIVTIPLGSPYIGTPIIVRFTQITVGPTPQTTLDDVSLTFEPVPEPGSLTLLGIGLVGLGVLRRRRRRSESR